MFVRNCWYVAAWDHQIEPGSLFAITIVGDPIVIYRTDSNTLVAFEDRCCHRHAPLSKGRIEDGCNLRCLYHGLKYAPDGRCIQIPGQDTIPPAAKVATYPVVSRHRWIWIWPGDPAKADPALIPAAASLDDDTYVMRHGWMDYNADYQLLNDNLTDFSHLAYVHAKSFGATEEWALSRPRVNAIDRGIRVTRWMKLDQAFQQGENESGVAGLTSTEDALALWTAYDYLAPGVLILYNINYRAADMPADEAPPVNGEIVAANATCQAVTPMTAGTTRYFYAWGPRRVDGGEAMADKMFEVANMAFAEDRDIIEAQQRTINLEPRPQVLTSADRGPMQMRLVIQKLIKSEQAQKSLVKATA